MKHAWSVCTLVCPAEGSTMFIITLSTLQTSIQWRGGSGHALYLPYLHCTASLNATHRSCLFEPHLQNSILYNALKTTPRQGASVPLGSPRPSSLCTNACAPAPAWGGGGGQHPHSGPCSLGRRLTANPPHAIAKHFFLSPRFFRLIMKNCDILVSPSLLGPGLAANLRRARLHLHPNLGSSHYR